MVYSEIWILTIAIGVIYGYLKPGREDRIALLKKGALIGVILGLVVAGYGMFVDRNILMSSGVAGMIGLVGILMFIVVILVAVLFIIGTFIGDWLEEKGKVV